MMDITYSDYWKQVNSLAEDLVDECKHDDLEEIDNDTLIERLNETIDGHQWIIYYSYNDDVLKHTGNDEAWLDCYAPEDIGNLVVNQGMTGARSVQAYFAMEADVMGAIYQLAEDRGLEIT